MAPQRSAYIPLCKQTGAAKLLAEGVVSLVGGLGPLAITASLFILTTLATQVMPNPAVAVLLGPIALNTATDRGISPYALMMTVAIAASAVYLSLTTNLFRAHISRSAQGEACLGEPCAACRV